MSWPRLFWLVAAICRGTGSGIDRRDTSPAMTRRDGRRPVTVRGPGWRNLLSSYASKNTSVRSSMLSRGIVLAGALGSVNAVCGMNRARPSLTES